MASYPILKVTKRQEDIGKANSPDQLYQKLEAKTYSSTYSMLIYPIDTRYMQRVNTYPISPGHRNRNDDWKQLSTAHVLASYPEQNELYPYYIFQFYSTSLKTNQCYCLPLQPLVSLTNKDFTEDTHGCYSESARNVPQLGRISQFWNDPVNVITQFHRH